MAFDHALLRVRIRIWLVRWLYLVGFGHLAGGFLMSWWAELPALTYYHQQVVASFGGGGSTPLMDVQLWWFKLFGATLQAFSLFMLVLVYVANRTAERIVWIALALTIVWWAPQDMYISLQQSIWSHVWVDLAALLAIVPAAIWLAFIDRNPKV